LGRHLKWHSLLAEGQTVQQHREFWKEVGKIEHHPSRVALRTEFLLREAAHPLVIAYLQAERQANPLTDLNGEPLVNP